MPVPSCECLHHGVLHAFPPPAAESRPAARGRAQALRPRRAPRARRSRPLPAAAPAPSCRRTGPGSSPSPSRRGTRPRTASSAFSGRVTSGVMRAPWPRRNSPSSPHPPRESRHSGTFPPRPRALVRSARVIGWCAAAGRTARGGMRAPERLREALLAVQCARHTVCTAGARHSSHGPARGAGCTRRALRCQRASAPDLHGVRRPAAHDPSAFPLPLADLAPRATAGWPAPGPPEATVAHVTAKQTRPRPPGG